MTAMRFSKLARSVAVAATVAAGLLGVGAARAETTVSIAVVNDFAGWNPYADSTSQMYNIWCQVYGCLGTFDTRKGEYEGMLAQSWETDKKDPRIWIFHLKHGMKRHKDCKELTAEDVVHSIERTKKEAELSQERDIANKTASTRAEVATATDFAPSLSRSMRSR